MPEQKQKTVPWVKSQKSGKPLVAIACYTANFARILDSHADILLVGDSLGMVIYGMESTLPVTLDMMINHGRAVAKNARNSLVVVDMPFGSYQESKGQAFRSAAKIIAQTGCGAVKLEGGTEMAETVQHLAERGVPVMAHIGLMPQHVNKMGGYHAQGRDKSGRAKIMKDALALEKAGAFSIVLEGVQESLAIEITEKLSIPTIGIGASVKCDGQVLVADDMAGLTFGDKPKFVKEFGNLAKDLDQAAESFANEVRSRKFPGAGNVYK